MARDRKLSSDFWTSEAVIDCAPMTRLLFLGLQNFADDFGVQPLRPRTIRMQVFPGDPLDNDQVRSMLDELAARGLVRIYTVDGQEYLAIVDWERRHRVGKRARRLYPAFPDTALSASVADEGMSASAMPAGADDAPRSPSSDPQASSPHNRGETEEVRLNGPPIEAMKAAVSVDVGRANRLAVPAAA